jgi:hypothetical protein
MDLAAFEETHGVARNQNSNGSHLFVQGLIPLARARTEGAEGDLRLKTRVG